MMEKQPDRILVTVIGNRNAGKSYTWNTLFGHTVRTGCYERELDLGAGRTVSVYLVSGSAEERKEPIDRIIVGVGQPRIVLCSVQYHEKMWETLDYFFDGGYAVYAHWLNPGYKEAERQDDHLDLIRGLLGRGAVVGMRDGKVEATARVEEMRDFVRGWALPRGLVREDRTGG